MSSLKFYVKPSPGERVETELALPGEQPALILGTVRLPTSDPAGECAVLLYADGDDAPLHQAFTDEQGRFCFGPLPGDRLYIINIYRDGTRIRSLEIGV